MDKIYLGHAQNPELQTIYLQAMTELQTFGRAEDLFYCRRIDRYVSAEVSKVAALEYILLVLEDASTRETIIEMLTTALPVAQQVIIDQATKDRYVALIVASIELGMVDQAIIQAVHMQRSSHRTPNKVHSYHAFVALFEAGYMIEKQEQWTPAMVKLFHEKWASLDVAQLPAVLTGKQSSVYSCDMPVTDVHDPAFHHTALTHSGLVVILDDTHVSVKFSSITQRNAFVGVVAIDSGNITGVITSYEGWDMPA